MSGPPDLATVAHALGGEIKSGEVLAPGPNHSAADRSLSVKLYGKAPNGFLVHSFAGDDPIACKDYVREKLGLPKSEQKKGNGASSGAWKFIREHVYRTVDGVPHLRKQKKIDPEGNEQFPQAHWDGEKWVKGVPKDWPNISAS